MLSIKACRCSLGKYAKNLDDSEVEAITRSRVPISICSGRRLPK